MKRIIATVIFSIFLSFSLFAQDRKHVYNIKEPVGISSVSDAASISEQILKAAGLKANFMIAEAKVPNALAVLQRGKRYILYNPSFINQLTRATGTRWAAVSVLAHEIGHHMYNVLAGKPNRTLATELEADKFSGFVLEKMGATLEEAQAAMNILATPFATSTHPARRDRVNSIAAGWELAGGVMEQKDNTTDVLSSSEILARLKFNSAPDKDYFITQTLNIVQLENEQVSLIGRLSKSGNETYPFIITDTEGYKVFISSEGQIVNRRGTIIGKVTKS